MRRMQEVNMEIKVLESQGRREKCYCKRGESHWGVSIVRYLTYPLFFTPTLLYPKPLLLSSHILCTSKTSHTSTERKHCPFDNEKLSLQFLKDSPCGCTCVSKMGGFIDQTMFWGQVKFTETYLFLENDIGRTNVILSEAAILWPSQNDGFILGSQLSNVFCQCIHFKGMY